MGTAWKYFYQSLRNWGFLLLNFDIIESFLNSRYRRVLTARPMSTTRYWLSEGSVPICKKIFWRKLFVFLFQINWQGHTVLAACRLCSRQNRTKQNLAERQMLAWHQASRFTQICLVFWQITNYDILTLLCSTYSMLRFFWYSYIENHEDANELSEAEGDTKFEGRESRDHGRSSPPWLWNKNHSVLG